MTRHLFMGGLFKLGKTVTTLCWTGVPASSSSGVAASVTGIVRASSGVCGSMGDMAKELEPLYAFDSSWPSSLTSWRDVLAGFGLSEKYERSGASTAARGRLRIMMRVKRRMGECQEVMRSSLLGQIPCMLLLRDDQCSGR